MSTRQEANHDQPAVVASTTSSPSDSASGETIAQLQSATDQAGSKSKPRWTARRSWAWAVAGVTGAALAAAGLSVATPIVVQPGTTAGYLYFPKATMAEELLKAEVQKLRAELSKLQDETVKALSDGLVRLRTDTMDWNATDAPTGGGFSLHRHIGNNWDATLNSANANSLLKRIEALEGRTQPAAFDDSSLASRIAVLENSQYAFHGFYGFCAYWHNSSSCDRKGPFWPVLSVGSCADGFAWVHTAARWSGKNEIWTGQCMKQ
jgi:hypothetical protein